MADWQLPWLKHPAHHWQPGTLDRAALDAAAAALAQRPGFDAVARRFAEHWLGTLAAHPELRAVFRNTARYLLLVLCLVLHHRRDPADPRSGPTPTALQDFFSHALHGKLAASRSQVQAMVAHARLLGLLQGAEAAADWRLQLLRPTPKLQRILQDWVAGFLQRRPRANPNCRCRPRRRPWWRCRAGWTRCSATAWRRWAKTASCCGRWRPRCAGCCRTTRATAPSCTCCAPAGCSPMARRGCR